MTVATLRKLLAAGPLDPAAETVIINSGDGLKTLDAVAAVVRARPDPGDPQAFAERVPAAGEEAGMTVSVRIPTILRSYTGGAAEVSAPKGPCAR